MNFEAFVNLYIYSFYLDIINSHRQTRKSNYHSQTETTKYEKVSVAVTRLFFSDKFIQRTEQTIIIVFFSLKKKEKQTQWVLSFGPWNFDQVIDFFLLYAGPQNQQTIKQFQVESFFSFSYFLSFLCILVCHFMWSL